MLFARVLNTGLFSYWTLVSPTTIAFEFLEYHQLSHGECFKYLYYMLAQQNVLPPTISCPALIRNAFLTPSCCTFLLHLHYVQEPVSTEIASICISLRAIARLFPARYTLKLLALIACIFEGEKRWRKELYPRSRRLFWPVPT